MITYLLKVRQPFRIAMVILYVGCIAALSLLPMQDLPRVPMFRGADKIIHMMMYTIFSLLFCWAIKSEHNYSRMLLIVLVTVSWGVFMEFLQLEMHRGRSFSIYDILANFLGVMSGIAIYVLLSLKYKV
ncbi:MAG: VanZ family protein [Prolixibacteraceae bacterium]